MSCIAWDGKTMAGDKLATYGGTKRTCTKVFKIRYDEAIVLVGAVGDMAAVTAWIKWLKGGSYREKPSLSTNDSFTGMMVFADGSIEIWEWTMAPYLIAEKFHAIGSGRGEALGAMAMGADAKKAVEIASVFDCNVGNGVDVVEFDNA